MTKKLISVGLACSMLVTMLFPINAFASTKGFVSDTTKDFSVSKGSSYTFKVTPDNSNAKVSITTGNANIAKIINVSKNNNSYYATVTTSGKITDSTGVYIKLNDTQIKLCDVSVGYPVETTGRHYPAITQPDGTTVTKMVQDKGWQLQIEEKPITYQSESLYGVKHNDDYIELDAMQSLVNENEKFLVIQYGGSFDSSKTLSDIGFKLTNVSGKELEIQPYGRLKFKVDFNSIDDVKTMYFGMGDQKAKLTMVEFK
jgi:hypothetical protein